MKRRGVIVFMMLLVITSAVWLARPWQYVPDHWNPTAPLSLDHPLTLVSRWKLARLDDTPGRCLELLNTVDESQLDYRVLPDHTPVEGCPLTNVVRVARSQLDFNASFLMSCPLLVRWLMFESQQLQHLALRHLDSRVQRIEHLGTFACRNVYGRETGRRSQHATASAFDIAGFVLEDGREITLLGNWGSGSEPDADQFLRDVHEASCRYFGTVLGPDYNRAHANHFHLDNSRFSLCR